ncbi:Rhodopsin, GQ-coupled [Trichoplax sp. H2]|uniref:G-protein coupled receptors family 1 profile domain-containing protein n=1 Tax=Trichoplax adhaerens TaxID=10228 RepID=B3S5J4_TRIAD|nr:hypothetical protein TRIADDRAFT_59637 [Trichoplax adhaerens]EDV22050.1 hypothetical protein TRIADDRAFT_59637 [Trichoplax adhaerens]RDD41263.1 Rhodopsin, GQ-coupled [Trichoplax sp. H2]|eukprot:XP_002115687.1 hypothetical protein TRIADDRAFT_59637 [Trichoplax adhaerens]
MTDQYFYITWSANRTAKLFNREESYVLSTALIIILVSGITLNSALVIKLFRRKKKTPTDIQVINLATADFCFLAISGGQMLGVVWPTRVKPIFTSNSFQCRLVYGLMILFALEDVLTMTTMAVTRFIAIRYPNAGKKWLDMKSIVVSIIITWVLSCAMSFPPIIGFWSKLTYYIPPGTCLLNFKFHQPSKLVYLLLLSSLFYAIPIIIIGYCYVQIINVVRRSHRRVLDFRSERALSSKTDRPIRKNLKQEISLSITLFGVFFTFLLAYTPYILVHFLEMINSMLITAKIKYCLKSTTFITCIVNPILFLSKNIKRNYYQRCCWSIMHLNDRSVISDDKRSPIPASPSKVF